MPSISDTDDRFADSGTATLPAASCSATEHAELGDWRALSEEQVRPGEDRRSQSAMMHELFLIRERHEGILPGRPRREPEPPPTTTTASPEAAAVVDEIGLGANFGIHIGVETAVLQWRPLAQRHAGPDESADESANESANESARESANESACESANESANEAGGARPQTAARNRTRRNKRRRRVLWEDHVHEQLVASGMYEAPGARPDPAPAAPRAKPRAKPRARAQRPANLAGEGSQTLVLARPSWLKHDPRRGKRAATPARPWKSLVPWKAAAGFLATALVWWAASALTSPDAQVGTALAASRPQPERHYTSLPALRSGATGAAPAWSSRSYDQAAPLPLDQAANAKQLALLRQGRTEQRVLAARALAGGGREAIDGLVGALRDPSATVRNQAIESLYRLARWEGNHARIGRRLLADLERTAPERGIAIVRALGAGRETTVHELAQLARSGEPARVHAAIEALGRGQVAGALDVLAPLTQAADRHARALAVVALGRLGTLKAVDTLIPVLQDEDRNLREAAHRALRRLTGQDRLAPTPELWRAWWNRGYALRSDELDRARLAFGATDDPTEQLELLRRFARMRDVRVFDLALRALEGDGTEVHRVAVQALGVQGEIATPLLIERLRDADREVAAAAHEALVRVTGLSLPADPERWTAWWRREG